MKYVSLSTGLEVVQRARVSRRGRVWRTGREPRGCWLEFAGHDRPTARAYFRLDMCATEARPAGLDGTE
jgi:hypothetical protein